MATSTRPAYDPNATYQIGVDTVEYRHDGNVVGVEDPEAGVSRMY